MTLAIETLGRLARAGNEHILTTVAGRLHCGRLTLQLSNGALLGYAAAADGPEASLVINDARAVRRILTGGATGFAEAYIDGLIDSPDLHALILLVARNEAAIATAFNGKLWYRAAQRLQHVMRPNSRRGARRNIAQHYDLGNTFYAAWLDLGMNYSAGIYGAGDDMESAQINKYRRLAAMLAPSPADHVLELGCGWGGFAEWLAAERGCRVTAVTISRAQYEHASERIQRAGLGDRVDVRRCDYRDVAGRFDHAVSIEMLEAVGEHYWPAYFQRLHERLRPGGRAALQMITIADELFEGYRRRADFIQTYIFPGGMLPAPTPLRRVVENAGLAWRDEFAFGEGYARTLADWHTRFDAAWPEIATRAGFDERFRRMWTYYLAYCRAGFDLGRIDVKHILLARD